MFGFMPLLVLAFFQNADSELVVQEEFRVDFVRLDLLVLDRSGQPITDLTSDDFVVKEGRKTIKLEFFEPVDYRMAFAKMTEGASSEDPRLVVEVNEENPRPQFIFATDLESVPLVQMRKTFTQLREALEKGSFPEQADYLLYSMESGSITDGFVPSLKDILHHVNKFEERLSDRYAGEINNRGRSNFDRVRGAGRASTGPRNLAGLETNIGSCLVGLRKQRVGPEDARVVFDCISDEVDAYVEQEALAVKRIIGELEALTLRFQEHAGLKTLFFISPGFSLQPGIEAAPMAEVLINAESRDVSTFPFTSFNSGETMEDEFRRVTHACIRNRVVFHTLDIFGTANEARDVHGHFVSGKHPRTKQFYKQNLDNYTTGLAMLARESGGFHLRAPSLENSLTKVIPRLKYQYLLGYTSPSGRPGKYRKIKIKCKRKGAKLHYRRGYFGKS